MLKRRTILLGACAMLAAFAGCGSDSGADNGPPVITELSVDHEAVLAGGGLAAVTVAATDPDGDPLQYAWSVTAGTLDAAAGPGPRTFAAPAERGIATITVAVSDGQGGVATQSVDVGVFGWVPPASAGTVEPGLPFTAVAFSSADDGVVVGGSEASVALNVPRIFHFRGSPEGGAFTDETKGTAGHLTGAIAFGPNDIWTVGGGGILFHFDGAAWAQRTVPGGCAHGIDALSPTDIWVSPGEPLQTVMRHNATGGLASGDWQSVTLAAGLNGGVSLVAPDDGWVVGGSVARYDGTNWLQVDVPVTTALKSVDMVDANDGWIVGASGKSMHWDGQAWTEVSTPATGMLNDVWAVATDDVWAVGNGGVILHWDGTVWSLVPSPTAEHLMGITMVTATNGWIVGANSTILHLE
jgi:hypothetical protein